MKTMLILLAALSAHVAFAGDVNQNQTWTCRINTEKSNQLVSKKKQSLADAESFQLKMADGKIVGGYLDSAALNGATWEFGKPGPGADSRDGEVYTLRNIKAGRNGHLITGFDMDGWDHYNYAVELNPNNNTVVMREDVQLDCCDPVIGYAVYDCEVQN